MTILTLQPGPATAKDSTIRSFTPTFNFGTFSSMSIGLSFSSSAPRRGLIQFDLSSIPANAIVLSATLSLYCIAEDVATDYDFYVHRSLVEWFEGDKSGAGLDPGTDGSTWNLRNNNGSVAWSGGAGGASGTEWFATPTDTTSVTGNNAWFDWDVKTDVQNIVNGTNTNYGWWILGVESGPSENTIKTFVSSDDSGRSEFWPTLEIEYVVFEGTASGTSTVSGTLSAIGNLAGSVSGAATVSGTIITNEYIHGQADGAATVQGTILGIGRLVGSISGVATASGDIQGDYELEGSIAGTSTVAGDIKGVYRMEGESLGSSSAFASGSFEGMLRGSADGSSSATATGYAKALGVAALQDCYPLPLFHITDGSYKDNGQQNLLNFLSDRSGYRLNNWEPTVAQFKDGGRWANSPTAQGRRLKGYVYDNAIEVLDLNLVSHDQNRAIQFIHDLWYFQQGVADYWSSAWSSLPIYLVGRAARERNTFYAIVHQMSCPQLRNIFAQPFFDDRQAAMETITLRIERGHWLSSPPGDFECVEISSIRSWTVASWQSGN